MHGSRACVPGMRARDRIRHVRVVPAVGRAWRRVWPRAVGAPPRDGEKAARRAGRILSGSRRLKGHGERVWRVAGHVLGPDPVGPGRIQSGRAGSSRVAAA